MYLFINDINKGHILNRNYKYKNKLYYCLDTLVLIGIPIYLNFNKIFFKDNYLYVYPTPSYLKLLNDIQNKIKISNNLNDFTKSEYIKIKTKKNLKYENNFIKISIKYIDKNNNAQFFHI